MNNKGYIAELVGLLSVLMVFTVVCILQYIL